MVNRGEEKVINLHFRVNSLFPFLLCFIKTLYLPDCGHIFDVFLRVHPRRHFHALSLKRIRAHGIEFTHKCACLIMSTAAKLTTHGVSIQSSINLGDTSANSARMKNSRDLILGEIVYIAIIYHISDSLIYLLNGYDFYF